MENSTVLIVSLLTWLRVFAYLWYIDRKLKGAEGGQWQTGSFLTWVLDRHQPSSGKQQFPFRLNSLCRFYPGQEVQLEKIKVLGILLPQTVEDGSGLRGSSSGMIMAR